MTNEPKPRGRVLAIAGSDSGGGAGIQADTKTIAMLGGLAATAITALTIQNTRGVTGVIPTAPRAVRAQMDAVLTDIGADCIKTGMLGGKELIETIADSLASLAPHTPRVVDPVMVASSGDRLLPPEAVDTFRALMIAGATLITPNAPEAEVLTGKAVDTVDGQRRAAERLLERGALAALVKGGHIEGPVGGVLVDVLATPDGERFFEGPRIATRAKHGTGCTLAAGIAAGLARGLALETAIALSRAFLLEAIRRAPEIGSGDWPVDHSWPARDPETWARLLQKHGLG